jgi:glycosyltransferase involved in cell wall biosynthesis
MFNTFSEFAPWNSTVPDNRSGKAGGHVSAPALFQVLPRKMYFGTAKATSIDLSIRDLCLASAYAASTTIVAETVRDPFPGFNICAFPKAGRAVTLRRAHYVGCLARKLAPNLIVVQQHLPTAAAIAARLPGASVVLHAHNFQKDYRGGNILNQIHRSFNKGRYSRLAGIIHVSQTCADSFAEAWPDIDIPSCVVGNGLNFSDWRPRDARAREILYVGRCSSEKGVLEAASAVASLLPKFPAWRAQFILSAIETDPDYFERVRKVLSGHGDRIRIKVQRPFVEVKAAFEGAAIALAPSRRPEAFGRAALEAHAGGAALISSGAGALGEVSGDCALALPAIEDGAIARAVETLIRDSDLRQQLASAGADRVRRLFTIESQATRFDEFCGTLLARIRANRQPLGFGLFNRQLKKA